VKKQFGEGSGRRLVLCVISQNKAGAASLRERITMKGSSKAPLGVFDVVTMTSADVRSVVGAMQSGMLAWKFHNGHMATTRAAVAAWRATEVTI
jgi:hypothetical protein